MDSISARAIVRTAFALTLGAELSAALVWENHSGYRSAAVAPSPTGKTGFTAMAAAETGIQFTNFLSLEAAAKNQNLLSGAGVAAGDFDNDGWCDLYFCTIEGRNTLYRNLGNWRFEDVTDAAGVACPGMLSTGALFGDVDGDGFLDLLVAGNNGPNALFLNLRNGRFTNITVSAGIASKPLGSTSMALADLDGNGTLDLFVANYGENTILRSGGEVGFRMVGGKPVISGRNARRLKLVNNSLIEYGEPSAVYLNEGGRFRALSWLDGTFRDEGGNPLKELPMDLSLSVMMRDIDGDGVPDIYVCNDFQVPDRIWINDGKARFRALPRPAMRSQSSFSMGVDFADLDRDGKDDFIAVDMLSRFHTLRMTQMADTNMTASPIGAIDNRPQIRRNTLFWNRGDGTYAEIANFAGVAASDWSWTPAFLDVDLDGYEDLLISNGHAFDTQDLDTFERPRRDARGIKAAVEHLLSFPKLQTPNFAFHNRGGLRFEEVGAQWGFDSRQVCHGLVLADLDNDGDLDVVLSSLNAPALLYRNDCPAPRIAVRLKGRSPNSKGINARIKVLGGAVPQQTQEMIAGGRYLSSDEPVRTFAAGSPDHRLTIEVSWRSGRQSVIRDALPNRIYEIDEASATTRGPVPQPPSRAPLFEDVSAQLAHAHHEIPFDDFARQPLLDRRLSQNGPGVAWFDIDGDGQEELFVGTGRGGRIAMFHLQDGAWKKHEARPAVTDDVAGLAGWIDANGARTLLAALSAGESGGTGGLLKVTASPGSAPAVIPGNVRPPSSPGAVCVADVDGDGLLEVFVAGQWKPGRYPEPADSQLLRLQKNQLVPDASQPKPFTGLGVVNAAMWSDLDGDGFPELLLACEWGPLRVFRNTAGRFREATAELGLATHTGWWTSLATGDFDGDGKLDIVAGNWGLNSHVTATADQPALLYYGDFDGNGQLDLVHAGYDPLAQAILPRENLTVLGPAMPFLRARFRTHASFRNASVADLLGERAAGAKKLEASTLATTAFLNRGSHFEAVPLPTEAQLAPVFGINVADADGDGHEDIFLAQNFFATHKDIPRLDAGRGLWLRGDGGGRFTAMPGSESGVIVWGEQRGSAVADYDADGRIDLVVSQNGAETKLFHNKRAKPGLRVRLKGPPGNPDGFGAAVRLKTGDALGPVREVRSGSGYWSQDSAVQVLGFSAVPTHVLVRWPGGRMTEAAVPPAAKEITVEIAKP